MNSFGATRQHRALISNVEQENYFRRIHARQAARPRLKNTTNKIPARSFVAPGPTKKGIMSATYVPLISSGVAGPLGVLHLPRLWLKASLEAQGKLAAGYPGCGKGYDQMVLSALALDRQKTLDYIKANKPSYSQFESWVKQQPGVKLDKASVDKINADIRGYNHDDGTRKGILSGCGLNDDSSAFRDAVNLNNLD